MNKTFSKYLNLKIQSSMVARDFIFLDFDNGESLKLYAQGDCCSESWFESPTGEEALSAGAQLLSIELIDLGKAIDYTDELIQFYSIKIKTTNGWCDIEMRNSSNGYYGGFITLNNPDQYGSQSAHFESRAG